MPSTLNLSLTDELRAFIDANCGDGTTYATPSEFVRDCCGSAKRSKRPNRPATASLPAIAMLLTVASSSSAVTCSAC